MIKIVMAEDAKVHVVGNMTVKKGFNISFSLLGYMQLLSSYVIATANLNFQIFHHNSIYRH